MLLPTSLKVAPQRASIWSSSVVVASIFAEPSQLSTWARSSDSAQGNLLARPASRGDAPGPGFSILDYA